jgi:predicted metal-dependent HD superfamily phosphohydrolase
MVEKILRDSWNDLLHKLNIKYRELGEEIIRDIFAAYSEEKRYYHNLNHIDYILKIIEPAIGSLDSVENVLLAVWFHDFVYKVDRHDNEEQSAIRAEYYLNKLEISSPVITQVQQLILSTKNHQPLVNNCDCRLFLDSDLSILGALPDCYRQYANSIRREYAYLSDREYNRGRTKVLQYFLDKDRIYYSDYFYSRLEFTARINLRTEIDRLLD